MTDEHPWKGDAEDWFSLVVMVLFVLVLFAMLFFGFYRSGVIG